MAVTRVDWARSFLKWADLPVTKHNLWALVAWEAAEGGHYNSSGEWIGGAKWNPLNTTQNWQGATDFNWVGVKNYVTEEDGLNATLKTIKGVGHGYEAILYNLEKDAAAADTLKAVEASAWGTGGLALRILHDVKNHWDSYSKKPIGQ